VRASRYLDAQDLALLQGALERAGKCAAAPILLRDVDPERGVSAAVLFGRAEGRLAAGSLEFDAVLGILRSLKLPHRGGAEARKTIQRGLRLTPEEDTAIEEEMLARGLDRNRTIGALALEATARRASARNKPRAPAAPAT
jgi:hypothetical protein